MTDSPLISIVMPAYNASKYISDALNSILAQTYGQWELIIVDDCSSDGTFRILTDYTHRDGRIKAYQLEMNSGSAKYPRDLAVSYANGDLVCWVDADDMIVPEYLETLIGIKQEKNANIVCSTMRAFEGEDFSALKYYLPDPAYNLSETLKGCDAVMYTIGARWRLNANGWLCDKSLWESTSTYLDREKLWMNIDDLSTREMLLKANRVAFSDVIYRYRVHPASITKNISPKLFEILYTDVAVYDLFEKEFGKNSSQYKKAREQFYDHIIALNWKKNQAKTILSEEDNAKVNKMMTVMSRNINKCDVLSLRYGPKKSMLLLKVLFENGRE